VKLSDHDLKQLDDIYLGGLPMESLRGLSSKLLADLKEARERLNQNPSNSSRPPSSQAPWESTGKQSQDSAEEEDLPQGATSSERSGEGNQDAEAEKGQEEEGKSKPKKSGASKSSQERPGRPKGAPGYSRTQKLPVDQECVHRPREV
jgi:transposase